MAVNWIESEIIEHVHWTDTLSSIRFKGNVLPYKAGQFTKVGLKIDNEVTSRPYSYVSAPQDDYLEIVYVSVPGGILTPELQKLDKGDKILVMDKATGFFTMDEVPPGKTLWMLATGTGLGVFISILKTLKEAGKSIIISSNRKDIVGSVSDNLLNMDDYNE